MTYAEEYLKALKLDIENKYPTRNNEGLIYAIIAYGNLREKEAVDNITNKVK